jgi:hypothetical protein
MSGQPPQGEPRVRARRPPASGFFIAPHIRCVESCPAPLDCAPFLASAPAAGSEHTLAQAEAVLEVQGGRHRCTRLQLPATPQWCSTC